MGLGLLRLYEILTLEKSTDYYYYLISPVLKFLKNKEVEIIVKLGMYGHNSRPIEYDDDALVAYNGKKPYFM